MASSTVTVERGRRLKNLALLWYNFQTEHLSTVSVPNAIEQVEIEVSDRNFALATAQSPILCNVLIIDESPRVNTSGVHVHI